MWSDLKTPLGQSVCMLMERKTVHCATVFFFYKIMSKDKQEVKICFENITIFGAKCLAEVNH